nr:hypothetical protein Iba_chr15bCG6660 [Ipomoea batatas]
MSCPPPSEARRRSAEASRVDRVGCVGLLKILKEELWWSEGYWSLEVAWIFNREDEISRLNEYLKTVEEDAITQLKKMEHAMEDMGRDYCNSDTMRNQLLKENAELRQRLQLSEEQKGETEETKKGEKVELDQMKTTL